MYPCSSCHRHLRQADTTCPFCGTRQHTTSSPGPSRASLGAFALIAAATLGTTACAARPGSGDDGMTTTTAAESGSGTESESGDASTESSTESSTMGDGDGDTASDSNSVGVSFYAGSEPFDWFSDACDPFFQDCPDGEKCVPYASEGELVDDTKCVPVTGSSAAGEACVFGGIVEATDDCDELSFCHYTEEIDGEFQGVCVPFCEGTLDDPMCPEGTGCFTGSGLDGYPYNLCLAVCDPLAQGCADGQACHWDEWQFTCHNQPEAVAQVGDACSSFDACAAGSICVEGEAVPGCADAACCTEFCDVSDPNFVCSNPEASCTWFWEQEAPPGYEDVGVCVASP